MAASPISVAVPGCHKDHGVAALGGAESLGADAMSWHWRSVEGSELAGCVMALDAPNGCSRRTARWHRAQSPSKKRMGPLGTGKATLEFSTIETSASTSAVASLRPRLALAGLEFTKRPGQTVA